MRYRRPAKLPLYTPKPDRPKHWYIYESGSRRRIATGIPEGEYKRAELALQKYLNELGGQKLRAEHAADRLVALQNQRDEPIELCVNGDVVAHGRLVIVDDSYGVQITKMIQAPKKP